MQKSRRQWLSQLGAFSISCFWARNALAESVKISGRSSPLLKSIDKAIADFLEAHAVSACSVAISKSSKLLYARSFGLLAPKSTEQVLPTTLFRIASVSKPITAVAILQLVQRKAISLSDSVTSILELRPPQDPRWSKVTVRHLLQHTGGWDSKTSFDPMFHFRTIAKEMELSFPLKHSDIIEYMQRLPLDFAPGTRYAYSNFGYCLLGRIIEKVSKMSYEQFVLKSVFRPLGITNPRIGKTLSEERLQNEVKYQDESDRRGTPVVATKEQLLPWPYGVWDLSAMDSHGGWVASATDLVRFACDFDNPKKSRLLDSALIEEMFAFPSEKIEGHSPEVSYGDGWQVRQIDSQRKNVWHNGRLDGTSSLLVRRHDGFNWAILFNKAVGSDQKYLIDHVDPLMHRIVDSIKRWPTSDLFPDYFSKKER